MSPDFAELYAMAFNWDPEFEFRTVDAFLAETNIAANARVIDAGAGTGRFVPSLVRRGMRVLAVEPDARMLAVLERLPEVKQGAVATANIPFEAFETAEPVDAVLAMTDTLSYVFPTVRLRHFLRNVAAILRPGGIFVVDVGVWAGYVGESRQERWGSESEGWMITAEYSAHVTEAEESSLFGRRMESLTFQATNPGMSVERSQERETHAFTERSLTNLAQEFGLLLRGRLEPGQQAPAQSGKLAKRLFFCFAKTG